MLRPLLVMLLGLVLACAGRAAPRQSASTTTPESYASEEGLPIPIGMDDAVRGGRLAPLTIVVFSDYQCPYCAKLERTLERVREAYGEKVRVVFKNVPLDGHPHARLAAETGQGVLALAGPEAFWRYHDQAFREQDAIDPGTLLTWARSAGVDGSALESGLAGGRFAAKVEADLHLAEQVGVAATPTSFVNGKSVRGAISFESFKAVLDLELDKALFLAASGVRPDAVYGEATIRNLREAAKDEDEDEEERAEAKRVYRLPIAGAPARGPAAAPLTLVLFSDFQCPYCKRFAATLDRVRAEYGDRIQIVWRDLPLEGHPRAEPAAELARAARTQQGDSAFWRVHDALFAAAPALESSDLERIAKEVGLDVAKAMKAVATHGDKKGIDADVDLAEDFRVASTPQFFVNGHPYAGARPFEELKKILDDEMVRVRAAPAAAVGSMTIYDALTRDGIGPVGLTKRALAGAPKTSPFRGAEKAKVVIQEIADFECPYCRRGDATMERILDVYAGKVKIVWRDKPLKRHRHAALAAEAAREAFLQKGNAGFQRMAKLLFENQTALERQDLDGYAGIIGLDAARFRRALDDRAHQAAVEADDALTSEAGVDATPAFFIGPYFMTGAKPFSAFRRRIDAALAEVEADERGKTRAPAASGSGLR